MPGEDLLIREATAADVRTCAELIAAETSDDVEHWRHHFTDALHDASRRFLVAVDDGVVVAFGHLRYVQQSSRLAAAAPSGHYLSGVTVALTHRRRGIGQQLTRERIRPLRGVADCVYYVAEPGNIATLEMHRRLGFVLVGEVAIPAWDQLMQLHRLDLTPPEIHAPH